MNTIIMHSINTVLGCVRVFSYKFMIMIYLKHDNASQRCLIYSLCVFFLHMVYIVPFISIISLTNFALEFSYF